MIKIIILISYQANQLMLGNPIEGRINVKQKNYVVLID